jgi:hypothetical protein
MTVRYLFVVQDGDHLLLGQAEDVKAEITQFLRSIAAKAAVAR